MPATPRYALPYPALSDTPDVPRDLQALADKVEAVLSGPGAEPVVDGTATKPGAGTVTSTTWATITSAAHDIPCQPGDLLLVRLLVDITPGTGSGSVHARIAGIEASEQVAYEGLRQSVSAVALVRATSTRFAANAEVRTFAASMTVNGAVWQWHAVPQIGPVP